MKTRNRVLSLLLALLLLFSLEDGALPPVRDQRSEGSCWSFAAHGSMEADLIHDGRAGTDIDLSELALGYYATHSYSELMRNPSGDRTEFSGPRYLNPGGNSQIAVYTLANGGEGAPRTQTKLRYLPLSLSELRPTRPGYSFLGWAESADALTAQYQPGDDYTGNAALTLYAVWSPELRLDPNEVFGGEQVWVDGVACPVDADGIVTPPHAGTVQLIESYRFAGSKDEPHSRYPTALRVWLVTEDENGARTVERLEALDDVLQYAGFSIRITGKRGIRMISAVPTAMKNRLSGGGVDGWALEAVEAAAAAPSGPSPCCSLPPPTHIVKKTKSRKSPPVSSRRQIKGDFRDLVFVIMKSENKGRRAG